jgi:hypothetical protein
VEGSFVTHRYARATSIGAAAVGKSLYGGIAYGTTYDPEQDINSDDVMLSGGYDYKLPSGLLLCLTGTADRSRVHLDPVSGKEYAIGDLSAGVGLARASTLRSVSTVVGAGFAMAGTWLSEERDDIRGDNTGYMKLTAFGGAMLSRWIGLRAQAEFPFLMPRYALVVPFGSDNREISVRLAGSAFLW